MWFGALVEDQSHLLAVENPPLPPLWELNDREREQSGKEGGITVTENTQVCRALRLKKVNNLKLEFRCGSASESE